MLDRLIRLKVIRRCFTRSDAAHADDATRGAAGLVGGVAGNALGAAGVVTGAVGIYREFADLNNASALTSGWLTLLRGYPEPAGLPTRALALFVAGVLVVALIAILVLMHLFGTAG